MDRSHLELMTGEFQNCELILDGRCFREAIFDRVRLIYRGGEVYFESVHIRGPIELTSDIPEARAFIGLYKQFTARMGLAEGQGQKPRSSAVRVYGGSVTMNGGGFYGFDTAFDALGSADISINNAHFIGPHGLPKK